MYAYACVYRDECLCVYAVCMCCCASPLCLGFSRTLQAVASRVRPFRSWPLRSRLTLVLRIVVEALQGNISLESDLHPAMHVFSLPNRYFLVSMSLAHGRCVSSSPLCSWRLRLWFAVALLAVALWFALALLVRFGLIHSKTGDIRLQGEFLMATCVRE